MKEIVNVVGAYIVKDNKIFITQRSEGDKEAINKWEFPGGTIENQETNEDALIREMKEEFKVNVNVGKFIYNAIEEYEQRIINIYFYYADTSDEFIIQPDHLEYRWVTKEELKDYAFPPVDQKFVDYLLGNNI